MTGEQEKSVVLGTSLTQLSTQVDQLLGQIPTPFCSIIVLQTDKANNTAQVT